MAENKNLELLWEAMKGLSFSDRYTFIDLFVGMVSIDVPVKSWEWCIKTTMEALKKREVGEK